LDKALEIALLEGKTAANASPNPLLQKRHLLRHRNFVFIVLSFGSLEDPYGILIVEIAVFLGRGHIVSYSNWTSSFAADATDLIFFSESSLRDCLATAAAFLFSKSAHEVTRSLPIITGNSNKKTSNTSVPTKDLSRVGQM